VNFDRTSWWQEHVEEEAVHLMMDRKQRETGRKDPGTRYPTCRSHPPPVTYVLQQGPPPKVFRTSQNSTTSGEPSIQHKPVEDIS
jgi:hypothetical protein